MVDFDLLGFSLGSELGYTNVLNILELGPLPLKSSERDYNYPLVIGGGPAALNPEPMHDFFDLFCIGEGEELVLELVELYRRFRVEYKSGRMKKEDLLAKFCGLQGVYVPSLYNVSYDSRGEIISFKPNSPDLPAKIKKRIVHDLDTIYYPCSWIVPYIQLVHDRITLEIMRGCPNRCRFCQARSQYFPFRQKSKEVIIDLAQDLYKSSGYEEISLAGLSVTDHQQIEEVLNELISIFQSKAVSISIPSIKAKALVGNISSVIAKIKKTGLTFAPEAGTERLRNVLSKDFNSEEFFDALKKAYLAGYQHVKLYFMIGLPGESIEDLDAIIDFSLKVSELRREAGKGAAGVNISINTLIPKPHTPMQWLNMSEEEEIRHKQEYLRQRAKKYRRLDLSFHNRPMSIIEGVLSRGDRRLSSVILGAFKKGAKFDAWSAHFNFDLWVAAFSEAGIDPKSYLTQKDPGSFLPWDFIDIGIDKELLLSEFNKTIAIKEDKLYNSSKL
jgi:radical SAM family uncharacterized protein